MKIYYIDLRSVHQNCSGSVRIFQRHFDSSLDDLVQHSNINMSKPVYSNDKTTHNDMQNVHNKRGKLMNGPNSYKISRQNLKSKATTTTTTTTTYIRWDINAGEAGKGIYNTVKIFHNTCCRGLQCAGSSLERIVLLNTTLIVDHIFYTQSARAIEIHLSC